MEIEIEKSRKLQAYLKQNGYIGNSAKDKKKESELSLYNLLTDQPFHALITILNKVNDLFGEGYVYYIEGIILTAVDGKRVREIHSWINYNNLIIEPTKSISNLPEYYKPIIKADKVVLRQLKTEYEQGGKGLPLYNRYSSDNIIMTDAVNELPTGNQYQDSNEINQIRDTSAK